MGPLRKLCIYANGESHKNANDFDQPCDWRGVFKLNLVPIMQLQNVKLFESSGAALDTLIIFLML
jgi:hypothetical protein